MTESFVSRCESRMVMTSSWDWREGRMISASKIDFDLTNKHFLWVNYSLTA